MKAKAVGLLLLLGASAAIAARKGYAAMQDQNGYYADEYGNSINNGSWIDNLFASDEPYAYDDPYIMPEENQPATQLTSGDQNVAALLAVIRQLESNNDYSIIYGGQHFTDWTKHPNIRVPFRNPATGRNDYSTAAGAYQIIKPTWDNAQSRLRLPDFSPASQDAAALLLLRQRGAYDAAMSGDIERAFLLASKEWASLPGSTAMQNPKSMQTAMSLFQQYV